MRGYVRVFCVFIFFFFAYSRDFSSFADGFVADNSHRLSSTGCLNASDCCSKYQRAM